jgi:carbamoyltransferase
MGSFTDDRTRLLSTKVRSLGMVRTAACLSTRICYGLLDVPAILGISAFYHDAAAALVVDGRVVAAAQEERFTRRKHDAAFPFHATRACLAAAGISPHELDVVGFYEKPLLRFDRLLETYVGVAPRGFRSFRTSLPDWLHRKLHIPRELDRGLGGEYRGPFVFCEHHESHAASAFFASPFAEAAIVTMDGVGEWATSTIGVGRGNRLELTHEMRFPHSLGLLYTAFTYYLGFKVNSGEYKVMGLAPYGEPRFADLILSHLLDLHADGSFTMDMAYFAYCHGLTMTSRRFHRLFGGPPRAPDEPLTQRHMDLAASVQAVAEQVMMRVARHVHAATGMRNLVLAGGTALNCVANGRLRREGPFQRIWVQPASGDAGGALGVALHVWFQLLGNERSHATAEGSTDLQSGSMLGPSFDDDSLEAELKALGVPYTRADDEPSLCRVVAAEIAAGRVVGWFNGRMEYGPRALGARSILADPRRPDMQRKLNEKLKYRESFRPFAPSVLLDHCADWFATDGPSPYMAFVEPVAASKRVPHMPGAPEPRGLARLATARSTIPAVTHIDGSARIQTVDATTNPRFFALLTEFHRQTGCPVLVNTSFNVRGEPIVCTPRDAYDCFLRTGMDVLVLGTCVLHKSAQRALRLGGNAGTVADWGGTSSVGAAIRYGLDD